MIKTRRSPSCSVARVCLWLLALLLFPLPALAQSSREVLLYEEDFDQGEAPGWDLQVIEGAQWLTLGPANRPGHIVAADLDPSWRARWPKQPQPLVILNACETTALLPEVSHGFMGKLRWLGACGVVGTEIKVRTELALPFGAQLVAGLLAGRSMGEAVLGIRRGLLRQANPLGLMYSYYTPATLHLHDPAGCAWCQAHPPTRIGGAQSG